MLSALVLSTLVPKRTVTLSAVNINLWHHRLGRPNKAVLRKVRDVVDSGVKFIYFLMKSRTCNIAKCTKRSHSKGASHGWLTKLLQG